MRAPSKHVPLLRALNNKDPVEIENFRQVIARWLYHRIIAIMIVTQGPKSMSTEQATRFQPKPLHVDTIRPSESSSKEYSGFSHAINEEPITYRPTEAHTGQFGVRIIYSE